MSREVAGQKKAYHHGDLRRDLIHEAACLLSEQGEAGLSMRKLAARIGVSRTAPYHHFKDKPDLLCAIAEEGFFRFEESMNLEEDCVSESFLQQFASDYLEFALNNFEYYDLMFGGKLWKSNVLTDALKQAAQSCFRRYVDQIRGWQQSGLVNPELDALRYSQVSWSALHGMSRLLIDGIYLDVDSMKPICAQAGKMFWQNLTSDT